MPIKGLTNPPKAFLKLGQIRKGEKQVRKRKDGSTYEVPVDLDYFRVTFRPGEQEAEQIFRDVYGDKPRELNIRLAFPEIEQVWDANYECYKKGGMIASAYSDDTGAHWNFYRDPDTSEVLVRNRMPVGDAGIAFMQKPLDITKPVYTYKDSKNNDVPVLLEPVGRLQVVIPELAQVRVGYLEFRATSPKDIANLSRELAAIDHLARQAGKTITGIPMTLGRLEEEITKVIDGKMTRDTSWMVHINVGGDWGVKALGVIERLALPEFVEGEVSEVRQPQSAPEWFDNPDWDEPLESNDVSEVDEMFPPMPEEPQQPAESKAMPRQPDVPTITPKYLVEQKVLDNEPHAAALIGLLQIDGADPGHGMARIELYNQWREVYPNKDAKTRKFCAEKAIAGEVPS